MSICWIDANTAYKSRQIMLRPNSRLKIFLLSLTLWSMIHSSTGQTQDIRSNEVYILDQSCVEKKIIYCLIDNITIPHGIGNIKCQANLEMKKSSFGYYCKFKDIDTIMKAINNYYSPLLLRNNNAVILTPENYDLAYNNCKTLVGNFPTQYSPNGFTQSCLKPLAQERLLNAIGIEIKRLRSNKCADENCSKLDKVPPQ